MWYWGEKAQAEEVGGKGYLILHYSFLILGLKWPPPHKIALKCMKPQTLFPFPPRNVPCNSSGTSTVSEGERVAKVQGKGGNHFKPKNVSNCRLPEFSPELTSAAFACWGCVGHGQRSKQSRSIMSLIPAIRCGYKWIFQVCCDYQKLELWCAQVKRDTGISDWSN